MNNDAFSAESKVVVFDHSRSKHLSSANGFRFGFGGKCLWRKIYDQ